jgi:hypothetical protein
MTAAAFWWVNTVTVEQYLGVGANAASKFAAPASVACWVEDGNKLIRDSQGAEVVSSAAIHGPLDQAALFPVGSKVTVNGRTSRVLTLDRLDATGLAAGASHFVAHLT